MAGSWIPLVDTSDQNQSGYKALDPSTSLPYISQFLLGEVDSGKAKAYLDKYYAALLRVQVNDLFVETDPKKPNSFVQYDWYDGVAKDLGVLRLHVFLVPNDNDGISWPPPLRTFTYGNSEFRPNADVMNIGVGKGSPAVASIAPILPKSLAPPLGLTADAYTSVSHSVEGFVDPKNNSKLLQIGAPPLGLPTMLIYFAGPSADGKSIVRKNFKAKSLFIRMWGLTTTPIA